MDIATRLPSPPPAWVKNFARVGLTAKGIVYCLVGALAFMAAFELGGSSGGDTGKTGAFQFVLEASYGKILLGLVAIGLFCYALWRFIEAVKDTQRKGSDTKGIAIRLRYASSGIVYGALAFYAAKLVIGSSNGGGSDSRQTLARELLQQPFGQWLVGIVAVGTAIAGIYQIYIGVSNKYREKIEQAGLKHETEGLLIRAGKAGYIARGIVWAIIGWLFLKAALNSNAEEAGGSSSAFQFLESSSYGPYLLGAVALGLICYGIFSFMRARYLAAA